MIVFKNINILKVLDTVVMSPPIHTSPANATAP